MKIINKIYHWATATRLRKILSSVLAILVLLTSIRYIFLKPKPVKAAISEVNTTTSTTLSATSETQVNSMTLTPGAGDYLAIFTMDVQYSAAPSSNNIVVSIYVNSVQQTHTIRMLESDGSLTSSKATLATHSYITVGASQVVEVKYHINTTPAMTGLNRSLTLIPVTAANVTQVTATADDAPATNPTSYTTLNSMTSTPGAGDYLLVFSTSAAGTGATGCNPCETLNFAVFIGSNIEQATERTFTQEESIPGREYPMLIAAKVRLGASDTVTIKWYNSGSGTNLIAHQRTLTLIKVGANELYETHATADATSTSTTDERIDSMALAPKAGDYLAIYSGSDLYGSVSTGNDQQTYFSIYVNGTQWKPTERDFYREESIDNANMYDFTAGSITVGTGENVEVMWRGVQTGTRTIHERTFVLFREPVANSSSGQIYLGLNEGSDRFVNDNNSNTAPGELRDAVWKTEDNCKFGKCVYFDGSGDYILLNDDPDLDMGAGETVTVEGWFRTPDITSGTRTLVSKEESTGVDGGYKVTMNSSGQIVFGIDNDNTSFPSDNVTSTAAYDDNQWHHFAAVKNGSTSITLYIDANSVGTPDTTIQNDVSNNDPFFIGMDNFSSNPWSGFIDEVKIYRTARSASEVKADYNQQTPSRGTSASFGPDQSYLTNGLVAYWKMDETSWSNSNCTVTKSVLDSSGNGNNASSCPTTTGPTTLATGKYGNAGNFDGTDDYLDVNQTFKSGLSSYTTSMWVYVNTLDGTTAENYHFYSRLNGDSAYPRLRVLGDGRVSAQLSISGTADTVSTPLTNVITTGTWYFIAVAYDNSANTTKIYINGTLATTATNPAGTLDGGANDMWIGHSGVTAVYYNGKMDDFRVYNRALSTGEITSIYNWAPGPIGYWKIDENIGTLKSFDSSGNANDLTMNGGINQWLPGKYGSALNFDGTNDSLITTNTSTFDQLPQLTVSAWVYSNTASYAANARIVSKNPAASSGWQLEWGQTSGRVYFSVGYDTTSMVVRAFSMNANTWYYVTATWDGTSSATGVKLYLNGIEAATYVEQTNGSTTRLDDSANEVSIGTAENGTTGPFSGIIDEVKIYNYIRTASQINEDMNGGHVAPGSPVGSAIGTWRFDEGSDNTCPGGTNDACNSGSSGTTLDGINNAATWTNSSKFGKALSFNGTSSYVQVTDSADLDIIGDFTLSAWVARAGGVNGYIISKTNDSADGGYALLHGNAGEVYCRTNNGTSSTDSYTATGLVNADSVWHHVVAVRSGTSCRVYVDGRDRTNTVGTHTTLTANANNLRIGTQPSGAGNFFNGKIDDARIYNSALSAAQVLALYNQGANSVMGATSTDSSGNATWSDNNEYCPPGQGSTCTAPIGEWKFDENTGTTSTYDTSTTGNTGTLNNFSASDWVPGKFGSALNFDAADNRVNLGTATTLDDIPTQSTGMSISTWIYPHSNGEGNAGRIAQKDDGGSTPVVGWRFHLDSSNRFVFRAGFAGSTTDLNVVTTTTFTANTWQHVELSWDGSITAANVHIYINGVEATYTTQTNGTGTYRSDGANTMYIGNGITQATTFDGYIDNFVVYNYPRTKAQVEWDFNRGKPQGWWKMDETSWTGDCSTQSVKDSSGNGKTGAACPNASAPTVSTAGRYNSAGSFDGTNDYVSVLSPALPTGDFTYSAWINPTSVSAAQAIVMAAEDVGGTNEMSFNITAAGKLGLTVNGGSNDIVSNATLTATTWQHVVAKRSGSALTLYINGVPDSATGTDGSALSFGTCALLFGTDSDAAGTNCTATLSAFFGGKIDDVRVYNYALTDAQVKLLYNEGAALRFGPLTGTP